MSQLAERILHYFLMNDLTISQQLSYLSRELDKADLPVSDRQWVRRRLHRLSSKPTVRQLVVGRRKGQYLSQRERDCISILTQAQFAKSVLEEPYAG